jgi:hypothetical protein
MSTRPFRKETDDGRVLIKRQYRIDETLDVEDMIYKIVEVSKGWVDAEVSRGVYVEGYSYQTDDEAADWEARVAASDASREKWERSFLTNLIEKYGIPEA